MINILWILAAANIVYLAYALRKKQASNSNASSLADQIRILTVPEQHLALRPVPKSVKIKDASGPEISWWDKKVACSHNKNNARNNHAPEQLTLSDIDSTLR